MCVVWFWAVKAYPYAFPVQEPQIIEVTQNITQQVENIIPPAVIQTVSSQNNTNFVSGNNIIFDIFSPEYKNVWGEKNFFRVNTSEYRVFFPKGSYVPSAKETPLWWAWFIAPIQNPSEVMTLEYTIAFEEWFDFVKWWKLPWFCGGSCPRGGSEKLEWFSTRLMWRKDGKLELYGYFPDDVKNIYGKSFVIPNFSFIPGKDYVLSQKLKLNDIWQKNGEVRIFIDGQEVLFIENLELRKTGEVLISDILFATFFGWNDPSFATTKDTNISFKNFSILE